MTTDPLATIREQLVAGIGRRRMARRRATVVAAAVCVVAVGVGAVATLSFSKDPDPSVPVTGVGTSTTAPFVMPAPPTPPVSHVTDEAVWTIEQPPTWHRAGRELMPNLVWDSLTLATVPLRVDGERCAQLPTRALRDLGAGDALVSVFFAGPADATDPPWPAGLFDGRELPRQEAHDALVCAERSDLEVHWGRRNHHNQALWLLAAFGPEATEDVRAEAWRALSSLQPRSPQTPGAPPLCIVTKPWPMPEVPGDRPTTPSSGSAWHGTPALWTALPADGIHRQRKSAWWSVEFAGGRVEPEPDISVTWRRLGAPRPTVRAGSPGTNASTLQLGDFMLAGIDPYAPGCWEVSAHYQGKTLSYVYWHPPGLWTATDVPGVADGSTSRIEGRVIFDEEHNCFRLDQPGGQLRIVWPAGSTVTPDASTIMLPDGEAVRVGGRVQAQGWYATPPPPASPALARPCPAPRSEVAILTGSAGG